LADKTTGQQGQDSSKKKQAGEYLKKADKLLKSGEYEAALEEVEKCLEIDPGNFYAHAYKERIIAVRSKKPQPPSAEPAQHPQQPPAGGGKAKEQQPAPKPAEAQAHPTQEEVRKKFLEEKRKAEEDARKQAEEARRRAEEELRRRALELDAMHKNEETQRAKAEAEARRKALEEEKLRKEEEQRRKIAEEERARLEEEARKKAEELARKKLEDEIKAKQEAEAQRKQEEELIRAAEAEAKEIAKKQKLSEYAEQAKQLIAAKDWNKAVIPVLKMQFVEKDHADGKKLLEIIRVEQRKLWNHKLQEAESVPNELRLLSYKKALTLAMKEGLPDALLTTMLQQLRSACNITNAEHASMEPQCRLDAYTQVYHEMKKSGSSEPETIKFLERLKNELGITGEQQREIDKGV
jgi:hypothetical protein